MKTSEKGLIALACREAVVLPAYRDTKRILTWGIGHTAAAGDPKPVAGQRLASLKQALDIFAKDLTRYEAEVLKAVKVALEQYEFDAIVSWHFNTGAVGHASLIRVLNSGNKKLAGQELTQWNKPPEILGRRKAEQRQFLTGDYGDTSHVPVYLDKYPGKVTLVPTAGLFAVAA